MNGRSRLIPPRANRRSHSPRPLISPSPAMAIRVPPRHIMACRFESITAHFQLTSRYNSRGGPQPIAVVSHGVRRVKFTVCDRPGRTLREFATLATAISPLTPSAALICTAKARETGAHAKAESTADADSDEDVSSSPPGRRALASVRAPVVRVVGPRRETWRRPGARREASSVRRQVYSSPIYDARPLCVRRGRSRLGRSQWLVAVCDRSLPSDKE